MDVVKDKDMFNGGNADVSADVDVDDPCMDSPLGIRNPEGWRQIRWDDLCKLSAPTFVQVPARFEAAVYEVKLTALRAIRECRRVGQDEEHAWKLFLAIDQLLFARGSANADEETCAAARDVRLDMFHQGQWKTLLDDQRIHRSRPAPRSQKERQRMKVARVRTLAAAREEGRALATLTAQDLAPATEETLRKLRALFPNGEPVRDLPEAPRTTEPVREQVREAQAGCLRRPGRLVGPGPMGARAEHWETFYKDCDARELYLDVLEWITWGDLPDVVLRQMRSCRVIALAKDGAGVRPLQLGMLHRRMAHKGLVRAAKSELREAAGPHQFAVGTDSGAERLVAALYTAVHKQPNRVVVALDTRAAFQNIQRGPMLRELAARAPSIYRAVAAWYREDATHKWMSSRGVFHDIRNSRGVQQGCPFGPAAYAIGSRPAVDCILTRCEAEGIAVEVMAYRDDTYLVADAV